MKKFILSLAAIASTLIMMAEGYQVNTLSVKQEGMAHTGVSLKLGAESMMFNPAGMAFMNQTADFSASVSGIISEASVVLPDGQKYTTDNAISTPLQVSAAFSILDNLKAGITFNTPYGSGINWTNDWPGSMLSQSVKLQVYNLQPTLAYKILPNLSVGAGLMIAWGNFDLSKGLVDPATIDKVLASQNIPYSFGNTAPASINLSGSAEVAFGYNVGILWDITNQISIGANYRSKMDMKVATGNAKVVFANEIAQNALSSVAALDGAQFKAQLPAVSVLSVGISYKPIEKLTLAFDAQMSGWSAYDKLDIDFAGTDAFDQSLTKNYSDSWAYRLGAEYNLNNSIDLRAGFIVDTTPVDENYYNPETPGMTRLQPTLGLSYRPIKNLSIDVAFNYVTGISREGANTYDDLVAKQAYATAYQTAMGQGASAEMAANVAQQTAAALGGLQKTFTGKYSINAFIPAIGVSYSF